MSLKYFIQLFVLFAIISSLILIKILDGCAQDAHFEITGLGNGTYYSDPILEKFFGNELKKIPFKDCFWSTCCSFQSESPNPTRHDNWMFLGKKYAVGSYTRDYYGWGYLFDTVLIAWNTQARNIVLNSPNTIVQKVFYKGRAKIWDAEGNELYNENIYTPVSQFPTFEGWMPDAYYYADNTSNTFELVNNNGDYQIIVYESVSIGTRLIDVDGTRIDFYAMDHPAISDIYFEEGILVDGQRKYADSAAYWANFKVISPEQTPSVFYFYVKIGLKRDWNCDSWYTGYAIIGGPSISNIPDWATYPEQP